MEEQSQRIIIIAFAILITIISLSFILFFVLKSYRKNRKVINEEEDIHGASARYNCPKCNQPMEKGYALAGRGIIYQSEGSPLISPFTTVLSVLDNTMSLSIQPAVNRAWHCLTCKYLLLDHSMLIRRKKN